MICITCMRLMERKRQHVLGVKYVQFHSSTAHILHLVLGCFAIARSVRQTHDRKRSILNVIVSGVRHNLFTMICKRHNIHTYKPTASDRLVFIFEQSFQNQTKTNRKIAR